MNGPRIELPTLYAVGARDAILFWRTFTEGDIVVFEYGKLNGKKVQNRTRAAGTNMGRANQRTGAEQASAESQSAWTKKIKQGYFETIEAAKTTEVLLPMLAHPINKRLKRRGVVHVEEREIGYPIHLQRKLNGLRCFPIVSADSVINMKSRTGTMWELLLHLELAIAALGDPGDIFDGEVYLHGVPLQVINGWAKNGSDPAVAALRATLQFHIYDMPRAAGRNAGQWEERRARLMTRYTERAYKLTDGGRIPIEDTVLAPIRMVETFTVNSRAELDMLAKSFVLEGYEGGIIRKLGYEYAFDERVEALLKWKQFTDTEFRILDILSREYFVPGTTRSFMILDKCVCKNNLTDETFEVVPLGTIEMKKEWHETKDQLIDKRLTVRYLERSVDGIPQGNPVGVAFRLDDDDAGLTDEELDPWS